MVRSVMQRAKKQRFPQARTAAKELSRDPKLRSIIKVVGEVQIELDSDRTLFEALTKSIIYQQLHGKAAATIHDRFQKLFSPRAVSPSPKAVLACAPERLRSAGLSQSKMKAILDLAQKETQGLIPTRAQAHTMDDEELIERLSEVRGIGRWTAQMLLIFTLGRTDVWPVGDYGVRKAYALVHGKRRLPTPRELERAGERWKPFRSAAAWYLWRALEIEPYRSRRLVESKAKP